MTAVQMNKCARRASQQATLLGLAKGGMLHDAQGHKIDADCVHEART